MPSLLASCKGALQQLVFSRYQHLHVDSLAAMSRHTLAGDSGCSRAGIAQRRGMHTMPKILICIMCQRYRAFAQMVMPTMTKFKINENCLE